MIARFERALRAVENILVTLSLLALVLMMSVMVVDVILRYLFGAPFAWALGFVSNYLMIGFFFLGLPYTMREGAHVHIDLLYQRLPALWRRVCRVLGGILGCVFVLALGYGGVMLTVDALAGADRPPPGSAELSWPVWTSAVLVPIGTGVLLLRTLCILMLGGTEESDAEATEPESSVSPLTKEGH
ncbi:TRAP-type C4-dicarboxylate transport system permease small subunit [Tamaricihabitans halophyticus]|uniref:TRAP-type C4-dicarboxylate transport system permease small subunit n=1 Tax=Tamaricihabitans halophyticus TaxID=1262583 RepID=A0A4R2Q4A9_9PSEU|nr:TRAP transporter small permease subunit [Tamaricihabitans halophyticus]TCP43427.1 TRAP-type C4-dicarboxylate transport system permease small subunit [Tamaricihabitans halophyticus]